MKHRLDPDKLAVQSFAAQALSDDEAYDTYGSGIQCASELSACGICPPDPCPLTQTG